MCRHNNTYKVSFLYIIYLIRNRYGLASSTTLKVAASPVSTTTGSRGGFAAAVASSSGGFAAAAASTGLTLTGLRHVYTILVF